MHRCTPSELCNAIADMLLHLLPITSLAWSTQHFAYLLQQTAGQPNADQSLAFVLAVPANQLVASPSRKELEVTIKEEKQKDHSSWEPDLLSEETRLQKRLDRLKLDMHVVSGDGNCQFRSVSFTLFGTQDYHRLVRRKAAEQMR